VNFDSTTAVRFGLVLARVTGVLAVSPLAWQDAPMRARGVLALFCTILVVPSLENGQPLPEESAIIGAPMEMLLGVAIGMVPRMLFSVAQMLGDLLTPLFGLNGQLLFGAKEEAESALSRLIRLLVGLLGIGLGIHRVVLAATLKSFFVLPPGTVANVGLAAGPLVAVSTEVMLLGLRLAMPLIAVHLATQTALAFVSRAAPAMQVFSIGFAASIAIGFVTLLIALPDYAIEMSRTLGETGPAIERVILAVMP
jgi:flagellar biosynthetic protein FliR